jgi:flagellin-like protein
MPRRPVRRDEKGVSPVIATIILVAVAIVMSIAVAYWALGLGGAFTRYEKLEIVAMYATTTDKNWTITAKLRNTGSTAATVNLILLNGKPISAYSANVTATPDPETNPVTIGPATEKQFIITINKDASGFGSGVTVEVTFHTAAGSDYPKVVVLP